MHKLRLLFLAFFLVYFSPASKASDHADPFFISTEEQAANLTGLFFFPKGDQYILILDVRRSLTAAPPYILDPFEFDINIDTHSEVTFNNAEDKARYGGTLVNPEGISPDINIRIRLNNDVTVKEKFFKGLKNPEKIVLYTGVRDDPFIFPKFFNVNVITMVMSIPKSSFSETQKNMLLWATSMRIDSGKQFDHVGRSNRTQLGRFEILNTIPPSQHVGAIKKRGDSIAKLQKFLQACLPPLANLNQLSGLLIRHYDYAPDVMVFSTQFPPGFPNGRRLEDDVALLTCNQGDCPLQENAFIDTKQWPRATVNDKPLLADFPFLAEPWPAKEQARTPTCWPYIMKYVIMPLIIVVALIIGLVIWNRSKCGGRSHHCDHDHH
ncbi:MAG: hypothetical protein HOP23_04215 [Methylococcaceae bacterium]|nr:hypothetical protein [Methylococcaceae bacterium]